MISGGYSQWNYREPSALGYCPYIPFVFAFVLLMFFWTVISITLTVCLTVEFIGLYHDMRGRESDIDFWTLIDEPQIDTFGSMQEHATENYGKNVN